MSNRLAASGSPYLRHHASNPVDWYPWCDEAFELATASDKPVLVSIGYSACHWCHVMARESFEDVKVAERMNRDFINVKVDREERPDVDAFYMEALQTLSVQGGWPLNIFVTPERLPFFGGTYFPPTPRHGLPSWLQVLEAISAAWREERDRVEGTGQEILGRIKSGSGPLAPGGDLSADILTAAAGNTESHYDSSHGGFGVGPKFPNSLILSFLLRAWVRTDQDRYLEMVTDSLDHMRKGGLYDHVGGGFHRYTVDREWVVPHFEKMLYDNAQLGGVYTEAWQTTRRSAYRATAIGTLDYLLRDMQSQQGGFYASEDADSEEEEGAFYVWTREEVRNALGETGAAMLEYRFNLPDEGNFEGRTILTVRESFEAVARQFGLPPSEAEAAITRDLAILFAVRQGRIRPFRDEKILTDWNALAIQALAYAGRTFGEDRYVDAAVRAATYIHDSYWTRSGRLVHVQTDAIAVPGLLADYALLAGAASELFMSTGDEKWLTWAVELIEAMLIRFCHVDGSLYSTDAGAVELPVRQRDFLDGVQPSGTSAAIQAMLRVARITGDSALEEQARGMISPFKAALSGHPLSFGHMLKALDLALAPRREVVVVCPDGEADLHNPLSRAVFEPFAPDTITVITTEAATPLSSLSLLAGRGTLGHMPTAYLCQNFSCQLPVTSAEELQRQIALSSQA